MDILNTSFSSVGTRREGDELDESPASKSSRVSHSIRINRSINNDTSLILNNNDDEIEKKNRRKQAMEIKNKNKRNLLLQQSNKKLQNEIQLDNEAPLPVITTLSLEEINKRYEEWMKIAADNKINTTNTWNFELIDYFSKINYFRDGNSINFQKASCTLDGCVKVYSSRVDSVVSETGILLNGLAESSAKRKEKLEEEFNDNPDIPKKKNTRSEQTLAKDFSSINLKSFDLEFSVDPLFKKTCADFDEGGARGLLLNHLSIQENGQLIFDAGDATLLKSDENDIENIRQESKTLLDLSDLFDEAFDSEAFMSLEINPSLKNFDFGSSKTLELPNFEEPESSDEEIIGGEQNQDSFFMENNELYHDITMMTFAKQNGAFEEQLEENFEDNEYHEDEDLIEDQIKQEKQEIGLLAETENVFSYFDQRLMKNWAGPEHWKLKRESKVVNKEPSTLEKKAKVEKVQFEINFLDEENKVDIDELFDPSGTSTLSKKIHDKNPTCNQLPEDLHISSTDFLNLFTKSTFSLLPKKKNLIDIANENYINGSQGSDLHNDNGIGFNSPGVVVDYNSEIPSDIGENTFDNVNEANESFNGLNEELNLDRSLNVGELDLPELKRIQQVRINYMKTAKRVDVKLLKENLWKIINDEKPITHGDILENIEEEKALKPNNSCKCNLPFTEMVKELPKAYPKKKMKDLSVPFCFICLLHLANEHNLEIEGTKDMKELIIKKEEEDGMGD